MKKTPIVEEKKEENENVESPSKEETLEKEKKEEKETIVDLDIRLNPDCFSTAIKHHPDEDLKVNTNNLINFKFYRILLH